MTRQGAKTGSERPGGTALNLVIGVHLAAFALGISAQHLASSFLMLDAGRVRLLSVACGLIAMAAVLGASTSRRYLATTASVEFGVVSLVTLTILSILGTVILQGQPAMTFDSSYGGLAAMLRFLFLDDLFHSFGFSALLGLAAGALIATLFKKKKLTFRRLGVLGAHLGCLLALAGAAVGSIWGIKGRLNMHVNEERSTFVVQTGSGELEELPLGFTVRLEEFELLHYEPEFRLRIFEVHEKEQELVATFDPSSDAVAEGLEEHGVSLLDYWPEYAAKLEVEPVATGDWDRASLSALGLENPSSDNGLIWLFDDGAPGGGRPGGAAETMLAFFWDEARAERLVSAIESSGGSAHIILVGTRRLAVEVGKTYPLPGSTGFLRLVSAYKDLVIDAASKQPMERSSAPRNPAVQVEIQDENGEPVGKRWLFANFPSFGHEKEAIGPDMRYAYEGTGLGFEKGTLLVGETREAWTVVNGAIEKREPFAIGGTVAVAGRELTVAALHRQAVVSHRHTTRSDRALNPVAEVRLAQEPSSRLIGQGQAVDLGEGRILALTPKGDDVRDFISTLSVMDGGNPVLTRKVEVNSPLSFGGFSLYQSEYDPRDPTFSGFEVVRDPGLPLVYTGLILMMLAVMHVMLVVPVRGRMQRRTAAGKDKEQGDVA